MNAQQQRTAALYSTILGTQKAIREYKTEYNLRKREEREAWARDAYYPRVDMGETPVLKPGYREEGERGIVE